ncbi:MAG TPA: HAD-IC family P-type ATPase, partial [Planctomycetaceae bacterium]|nr:HAD-IC family P-type ATPase [Planctomycetaceae bacterium]
MGPILPTDERSDLAYLQRGLSAAEVAERVALGRVNRSPRSGRAEYRSIFVRNIVTLFNALVVSAATALFALGDYRSAWAVSAYAVLNTLIGLVQEVRAKRHLDTLAVLVQTKVRVLRDGIEILISADDIVQDDHIRVTAGEAIVADGTVLTARFLEVDEALLTGESDPVPRQAGDRLLSGSVCVAGDGSYRADQVGGESFAQQTSLQAKRYRFVPSPIQRILNLIIRVLTAIAVVLCIVYVLLFYLRGFPLTDLWQMIAATVTSMVPQGLVLMTTLALTLGAVRMSRRGAIVQRLNAVESMASVDVLCMDKTGTLTTNRLCLDGVRPIHADENEVRDRLRLFVWTSIDAGSKTIAAIRTALGPLPDGITPNVIDQVPFKSQNRYSAVRFDKGEDVQTLILGAVEALRPFLAESAAEAVEVAWRELLPRGLRLLLFAEARQPLGTPAFRNSLEGLTLRPLALV